MCTFRSSEKQLICSIHTQDWLRMALSYRNTLQGRRPTPFHTTDGIDHTPKDTVTHTYSVNCAYTHKGLEADVFASNYRCIHCTHRLITNMHTNTNVFSITETIQIHTNLTGYIQMMYSSKKRTRSTHNFLSVLPAPSLWPASTPPSQLFFCCRTAQLRLYNGKSCFPIQLVFLPPPQLSLSHTFTHTPTCAQTHSLLYYVHSTSLAEPLPPSPSQSMSL